MDDTIIASLKGFHLNQFQKQISKRAAFLPQYIHVVHVIGQQFVRVAEYIACFFLVPFQKLGLNLNLISILCPVPLKFLKRF